MTEQVKHLEWRGDTGENSHDYEEEYMDYVEQTKEEKDDNVLEYAEWLFDKAERVAWQEDRF